MQATAHAAFAKGGCFCLAGVVQGLGHVSHASIGTVDVPAVVACGDRDRSHRKTEPTAIHAHLPAAKVEIFGGRGHFPHLEDVDRFAGLAGAAARGWG
jgi:pimeloyl-ACP methyl ester carboxylesterase